MSAQVTEANATVNVSEIEHLVTVSEQRLEVRVGADSPAVVEVTSPQIVVVEKPVERIVSALQEAQVAVEIGAAGGPDQVWFEAVNRAGFTIQKGQPVKLVADGVALAQGNTMANSAVGMAGEQILAGASGRIVVVGVIEQPDWTFVTGSPGLVPQKEFYLAQAVAGRMTEIAPYASPDVSQILGASIDGAKFLTRIEPSIGL